MQSIHIVGRIKNFDNTIFKKKEAGRAPVGPVMNKNPKGWPPLESPGDPPQGRALGLSPLRQARLHRSRIRKKIRKNTKKILSSQALIRISYEAP